MGVSSFWPAMLSNKKTGMYQPYAQLLAKE